VTTLCFIHGAGSTGEVFAAQRSAFPDAIVVQLPGHDRAGDARTIAEFADAVATDLDAADAREVVLCGSSMGGAIALELGLRAHPRVRALVLLGSGARLRVAPQLFEDLERDFGGAVRRLARMFFHAPTEDAIERAATMMERVGRERTIADFRACDAFDVRERLAELHLPVLAVTGAGDVLTPPKFATFIGERVAGARVEIVPEAGHLVMTEAPQVVNDLLAGFVASLDDARVKGHA
jgi:pimeloyl-ACP methyl ester carboxylesterase